MKKISIIFAAMFLASCGGPSVYYAKSGMSADTLIKDTDDCFAEASGTKGSTSSAYTPNAAASAVAGFMQGVERSKARRLNYETCMTFRGYNKKEASKELANSLKGKSREERVAAIVEIENSEIGS